MNTAANKYTVELSKSFRDNLENYRDGWIASTAIPARTPTLDSGDFEQSLFALFDSAAKYTADSSQLRVVRVNSIFQLTNIPLLIALSVANVNLDCLRSHLKSPDWQKLWKVYDAQVTDNLIESLRINSSKIQQENNRKEINRFLSKLHESTGSTFDTTSSPKLSSIGLMINSTIMAESESLARSLESELKSIVSPDCVEQVKKEFSTIPSAYERMEVQLGLQIIPNLFAQSVRSIKKTLVEKEPDFFEKHTLHPGSVADLLKLIYQADLENQSGNPRTFELWGGARIGAYGDPAIRLLASTIQLDIFRQSQVLSWLPLNLYMRSKLPGLYSEENDRKLSLFEDLLKSAYAFALYDNICFVCDYPVSVRMDDEFRYHNESKPSLTFKDDTKVYSWHGRNVPAYIIENPEQITIEKIDQEKNIEIRTILIDRYGISKFLEDSEARVINQDEYGTLFQRSFKDDEPLLVVMVKNSTPEPDGSYKHYFLRVPPDTLTAKAGIAWTFGLTEAEYYPEIQT